MRLEDIHTLTHTYYIIALTQRVQINITVPNNKQIKLLQNFQLIKRKDAKERRGWPQPLPRDAQMMHARNSARPKNPYRTPVTSVYTALSL